MCPECGAPMVRAEAIYFCDGRILNGVHGPSCGWSEPARFLTLGEERELRSKAESHDFAFKSFMIEGDETIFDVCRRLNAAAVEFRTRLTEAQAQAMARGTAMLAAERELAIFRNECDAILTKLAEVEHERDEYKARLEERAAGKLDRLLGKVPP